MSDDPLTTESRKVTWQVISLISSISQGLWLLNLTGRWLTMRETRPWCYMTLWQRGHVRSREKLKAWYLLFHKGYNHQSLHMMMETRLCHKTLWPRWHKISSLATTSVTTTLGRMMTYNKGNSTHNDAWSSVHVVRWDPATNRKLFSSSTRLTTTKYVSLVIYGGTHLWSHTTLWPRGHVTN